MENETHTVKIEVIGKYTHGGNTRSYIEVGGDGGIEHMLQSFRTSLVAAGFHEDTAKNLVVKED